MTCSYLPHFFVGVGHLIQSHSVEFDGLWIISLSEVDVTHVHF